MKVQLTQYPYFDGTAMTPDPALLDELASEYARRQDAGNTEPAMTRFLFGDVPVVLFDRIFSSADPTALPWSSYLWLYHLSGYYGGVWLRGELLRSGHNAMIGNVNLPPNAEQFAAQVEDATAILERARSDVLAYNEESLFDRPNPDHPDQPIRGLVDLFGYNEGYLLQIAERPPAGLTTPADLVACPANPADAPLFCRYRNSRLAALATFEPVATKLREREGPYAELSERIAPVQEPGIARGRMVWDGQLDVQGFEQGAYEQLLDISSAFLETVQATALATVQAVAEQDASIGRRAAVANAMMGVWLRSYIVGLTDGREIDLPTFGEQ